MPRRKPNPRISIRNLKISNFKGLEKFEIEFPRPTLPGDPDVFVLGSKNGLGKTSILECCAMLFLAATARNKDRVFRRFIDAPFDPYDLLIRAGATTAKISGHFELDGKGADVHLTLRRPSPELAVSGDIDVFRKSEASQRDLWDNATETFSLMLAGLSSDPLVLPGLLYFHSFRKVQEGNPEFGMMVSEQRRFRRPRARPYEMPTSRFKIEILRSMMGQANLFETLDEDYSNNTLDKLNELVSRYAGGKIQKLRPAADNTLDFRIHPTDGGDSFAFDGLSSGQKEIISTLYLIWHYTHETPAIVLIDEPEFIST